jgi:hypothetical protein
MNVVRADLGVDSTVRADEQRDVERERGWVYE